MSKVEEVESKCGLAVGPASEASPVQMEAAPLVSSQFKFDDWHEQKSLTEKELGGS